MQTQSKFYKNALSNAHVTINRVLGDLMQIDVDESNRDLLIAIQYLKDAGRALNAVENILYVLGIM